MKFISQPIEDQHFDSENIEDLMMFRKAFDFESLDREKVQKELKAVFDATEDKSSENLIKIQTDFIFKTIVKFYRADLAQGWNCKILFSVDKIGNYAINIQNGKAEYVGHDTKGATCEVFTDIGSLATQLCILRLEDIRADDELTDADLEMVAGGKGGRRRRRRRRARTTICGGEACGGDACGVAGCGGAVCGGAACGGDACAAAGCGAAGCGGAACAGDACGAAACPADACAAAACGVAIGVGGCAGNACGVDVQGGADVGPCAVNVAPGVPGI